MSLVVVRRSDFVRPFPEPMVVTPETAFIDRVQIGIGDWALFGETQSIFSALSDFRNAEVVTHEGEVLQFFTNTIVESFWGIRELNFSANPNTDHLNSASTLVSGSVDYAQWRYRPIGRRDGEQARIAFNTQLNLTRFVQAQRLHARSRLDRPRLVSDFILAIVPEPSWYSEEVPLIPATNLIIGPDKKYAYALKSPRTTQLRRYLRLVRSMLARTVEQAFEGEDATAEELPYYALREIEFYWEFDTPSAIDYVVSLRPVLSAQSDDISERLYDVDQPAFGIRGQSPSFKIKLTQCIAIKIYAKTNRRVRFEVTLKDDAINAHAGPRSSNSIEGIIDLIPLLATEAASRMNPFLQSIAPAPTPPSSFTAVNLMHAITQDAREPYVAEAIISGLTTFAGSCRTITTRSKTRFIGCGIAGYLEPSAHAVGYTSSPTNTASLWNACVSSDSAQPTVARCRQGCSIRQHHMFR